MALKYSTDTAIIHDSLTFDAAQWRQQAEQQWKGRRDLQAELYAMKLQLAAAEEKIAALESLASSDPLTGLMNRRGFERFFDEEISRIRRFHSEGAVLAVLDLDFFKEINDTHGHPAGDACLAHVASLLTTSFRLHDAAARFGGDEFAVLLTGTNVDKCAERIKELSQSLRQLEIEWEGKTIRFAATLGLATVGAASTFQNSYRAADARLYATKRKSA